MRHWYNRVAQGDNAGLEISDITKVGPILWKLSLLSDPPLRLPIGKDTIAQLRGKLASVLADLDEYESWSDEV